MSRTRTMARLLALLAVIALLSTACSVEVGEQAEEQDPAPEQPMVQPETEPETDPVTPVSASQDDLLLSQTTPEFCEAGRTAFESFLVLDLIPDDAERNIVEPTMVQLLVDINLALEIAPNEELAVGPQIAFVSMNNIRNAAIEIDFDPEAFKEAADYELRDDYESFVNIMNALNGYLEGPCGLSLDDTYAIAEGRFAALQQSQTVETTGSAVNGAGNGTGNATSAGNSSGEAPAPVQAESAVVDVRVVESDWGDIMVAVPASWTLEESWDGDQGRGLVVAPDLSAFDSSWNADGVMITAAALDPTLPVDFSTVVAATAASNECSPAGNGSYADGLYSGRIHRFDSCAGGSTEAVVIVGVDEDHRVIVLVELQMVDFDEAVLQTITDSFRV